MGKRGPRGVDRDEVLRLYKEGRTCKHVGGLVGVSRQRVHQILRQEGVQLRSRGEVARTRMERERNSPKTAEKKRRLRQMNKDKVLFRVMVDELESSGDTLRRWFKEMDLKYHTPRRKDAERAMVLRAYKRGDRVLDIADSADVPPGTVSRWVKEAGLTGRNRQYSEKALGRRYSKGATVHELVARYGIVPSRVYQVLRKLGIPVRRRRKSEKGKKR